MIDCGEIGTLSTETGRFFTVTWRIDSFFSLSEEVNAFHSSPHFYFSKSRWSLKMYQNGDTKHASEGCIGVYLKRSDRGPPTSLTCVICIGKTDANEHGTFRKIRDIFSDEQPELGHSKFLRRSELFSRKSVLAPSDTLTVICKIYCSEPPNARGRRLVSSETQTEGIAGGARNQEQAHLDTKGGDILRKHFQDMLLNGKDHDVTLKVKGHQFRAHKSILRARSPVFAAMFSHNMEVNESGEVTIEDCDRKAFSEFLRYVYTGKVENMSASIATGLYYAAHKYGFPDLKETCINFLKESLTTNVICNVIALAIRHHEDELMKSAMVFFSKHVLEILTTVEWERFLEKNPILGNELIIKAMKTSRTKAVNE